MPKTCAICNKKKNTGNRRKLLRGHRNVTAKRWFKPNLQKTTHEGKRVLACVKCLRTTTKKEKTPQQTQ